MKKISVQRSEKNIVKITLPLKRSDLCKLKAGEEVLLTGIVYTARDAAHQRMIKKLPLNIKGQALYHTGPAPAKPGEVIGSCGPTTSTRMDQYTLGLLKKGLKAVIGKGKLGDQTREAFKKYQAVYFLAPGGCGALLADKVKSMVLVAYKDLGCEAIYKLEIEDFPVIVGIDPKGRSVYR
ncbi:MAG: FumA C-terminus/TtdB family hydratase beta subunit [bacterium]|nr:FumA C-terminus/TtdB family hydratase beta subunit [bacterium]MDD5354579.1 FumA C-terminus/TtdB family hydratase beta subunit [bacterium]MDD5757380.1 FumA C-terminus/TtdB family hydratase beta subunit [bacterium]